jgi:cell division protein ZapA
MAEINVEIAGRRYPVACEDGQEAHLARLASRLDRYAKSFDPQRSGISESQLLLMTALMVADELSEAEEDAQRLKQQATDLKARAAAAEKAPAAASAPAAAPKRGQPGLFDGDLEAVTAELLNQAAKRMEHLADRAEGKA